MNSSKKLICTLFAGAALSLAAPAFADSFHGHGYENYRHDDHFRGYDHRGFYDHGHYVHGYYDHRPVVVERPYFARRPVIVEQPVYYGAPAAPGLGIGALVGQALGSIYDYNH